MSVGDQNAISIVPYLTIVNGIFALIVLVSLLCATVTGTMVTAWGGRGIRKLDLLLFDVAVLLQLEGYIGIVQKLHYQAGMSVRIGNKMVGGADELALICCQDDGAVPASHEAIAPKQVAENKSSGLRIQRAKNVIDDEDIRLLINRSSQALCKRY